MEISKIPVNLIFSPSWWFHHYGVSFEEPFYLDPETRIRNDVLMRKALYERFGLGRPGPEPRPVIGSTLIAGGFVVPALLGVQPRFSQDQAAWLVPLDLDRESALALRAPDIHATWPMDVLIRQMDRLERQFGYVTGDLNTFDGLIWPLLDNLGDDNLSRFRDGATGAGKRDTAPRTSPKMSVSPSM